jgi:hypothetical protein
MPMPLLKTLSLVLILNLAGCANFVQMKRDELRYAALIRGTEEYKIADKDSLVAAKERASSAIEDYRNHMNVYEGIFDYLKEKPRLLQEQKKLAEENAALRKELRSKEVQGPKPAAGKSIRDESKMLIQMMPAIRDAEPKASDSFGTTPAEAKVRLSDPVLFWPASINKILGVPKTTTIIKDTAKKQETTTTVEPFAHAHPEELIRGLSSTASMGQIRDLITEPEIPELLPINRKISLGCLPPPDSAAFEAVTRLTANLERDSVGKLGISSEYADKVVKLFEESERTMFLQYALFRLCEMSVNTPSGFRNVFPVIMHDMVRRAAELRDVAVKEAETRRTEEEKTRQKELDLKGSRQKAYFDCLGSKKDKDGNLYTDETATACRRQVNIDLSRKE